MVKELQALALDIRVLNPERRGEVNLSALCNEDDQPAYRRRARRTERDPDEGGYRARDRSVRGDG